MYNFFSSKLKRKAFIKALAEVEESGIYADYTTDGSAAIRMPDVEAQIAALSKKHKEQKVADDTLDISTLSGAEISEASRSELGRGKTDGLSKDTFEQAGDNALSQSSGEDTLSYYDRLFDRRSFLHGEKDYSDVQFLQEGDQEDEQIILQPQSPLDAQPKTDQEQQLPKTRITTMVLEQMVRDKQARQAEELKQREEQLTKDRLEFSRLQQEELLRREEQEKSLQQREQQAELVARQAEEARLAALQVAQKAQADAAAAAAAAAAASKPARKTSGSPVKRKRRRRYDADIIGDFDF